MLYGEEVSLPIDHALLADTAYTTRANDLITHVHNVVQSARVAMK